ncbi:MAG: MBL fold metallo-hydrolase [Pseudomonadota bacterium]
MLCKIGEVEVWRLLDIHAPFLAPEVLFPNAGPDVSRLIEEDVPGGICPETGKLILPIQSFLLKTPAHVILVDTCVGTHKNHPKLPDWHQRTDKGYLAALEAAGVAPEEVDYVLCTHLHSDHVGWNTQLLDGRWVPTFPRAKYVLPRADEAFHRAEGSTLYTESVLPVIAAGQTELTDGAHKIGDHITLVPTPGHTEGHVSILIESAGETALITGDAIHSTAQCRHPHWHFRFDMDPEQAAATRRALLGTVADAGHLVLGSHFALPSLGHVEEAGESFRWKALDP